MNVRVETVDREVRNNDLVKREVERRAQLQAFTLEKIIQRKLEVAAERLTGDIFKDGFGGGLLLKSILQKHRCRGEELKLELQKNGFELTIHHYTKIGEPYKQEEVKLIFRKNVFEI